MSASQSAGVNLLCLRDDPALGLLTPPGPNVIGDACFHGGRNPECPVHSAEIVVHEIQGNSVPVALQFLAEPVREPHEAAHPHSH